MAPRVKTASKPDPKKPRRKRWRWAAVVVAALLLLLSAGVFIVLHPAQLTPITERFLSGQTGGTVEIDRATLQADGLLRLRGVAFDAPGYRPEMTRLFEADQIDVQLDFWALLRGESPVTAIRPHHPRLLITEDAATGRFNYERLEFPDRTDPEAGPIQLPRLPAVFLRDAQITLRRLEGATTVRVETLIVEGELSAVGSDPNEYSFELRENSRPGIARRAPVAAINGRFNTQTQTANIDIRDFRFEANQASLLPPEIRSWFRRLEPRGRVPRVQVGLGATEGNFTVTSAAVHFDGVDVRVPVPGLADAIIINGLYGKAAFRDQRVEVSDVRANVLGVGVRISGRLPLEPLGPMDLAIKLAPFDLTTQQTAPLVSLVPLWTDLQQRFEPKGLYAGEVHLTRAQEGSPLKYQGEVKLLDAQLTYIEFPYPLTGVTGTIEFDSERVVLRDVQGVGASGTQIALSGHAGLGAGTPLGLDIQAADLPVDASLLSCLPSEAVQAIELFMSQSAQATLIEDGVIVAPEEDADQSQPFAMSGQEVSQFVPPTFEPGGIVNVEVDVLRREDGSIGTVVDVTPAEDGVRLLFEQWPYPMQVNSGRLHIDRDFLELHELDLTGPLGGTGRLTGRVGFSQGQITPALSIDRFELPLSPLFYATLPRDQQTWIRQLGVTGQLVGSGAVLVREDDAIGFEIQGKLENAQAAPFDGRFKFPGLTANFLLTESSFAFQNLSAGGDPGQPTLTATGTSSWVQGTPTWDIQLIGRDMAISRDVLSLMPKGSGAHAQVRKLLDQYQPTGQFSAAVHWMSDDDEFATVTTRPTREPSRDTDAIPGSLSLTLKPQALNILYGGYRLDFTKMSGEVRVEPDALDVLGVTAEHESGTLEMQGLISLEGANSTLRVSGTGTSWSTVERALLPAVVVDLLDEVNLDAAYRLRNCRIVFTPSADTGPSARRVVADIALAGASLDLGIPITEANAELRLEVDLPGGNIEPLPGPRIRARL